MCLEMTTNGQSETRTYAARSRTRDGARELSVALCASRLRDAKRAFWLWVAATACVTGAWQGSFRWTAGYVWRNCCGVVLGYGRILAAHDNDIVYCFGPYQASAGWNLLPAGVTEAGLVPPQIGVRAGSAADAAQWLVLPLWLYLSFCAVGLLLTARVLLIWRRRLQRVLDDKCVACGYILRDGVSARCPECGALGVLEGRMSASWSVSVRVVVCGIAAVLCWAFWFWLALETPWPADYATPIIWSWTAYAYSTWGPFAAYLLWHEAVPMPMVYAGAAVFWLALGFLQARRAGRWGLTVASVACLWLLMGLPIGGLCAFALGY